MNVIADLLQRGKQIRVRWTEGGAVDHERRPDNNQRRTAFRALDSLLNRKTADGLHRDRDRGDDLVDLVEGAESADRPRSSKPIWWTITSTPRPSIHSADVT